MEVEVKIFDISKKEFLRRLEQLAIDRGSVGVSTVFKGVVTSVYFSNPLYGEDVTMRLNTEEPHGRRPYSYLTVKVRCSSSSGFKTCDEINLKTVDPKIARSFLELLGWKEERAVIKVRESCIGFGCRFEFDEMDGQKWVEVETDTVKKLSKILADLDIKNISSVSTKELSQQGGLK